MVNRPVLTLVGMHRYLASLGTGLFSFPKGRQPNPSKPYESTVLLLLLP